MLCQAQSKLGLKPTQFNILIQLLSYWTSRNELPFPSTAKLAKRMGITKQTLQRNLKALEELGYIRIKHRKTTCGDHTNNQYDLKGLVLALKKLEPAWTQQRKAWEKQALHRMTQGHKGQRHH